MNFVAVDVHYTKIQLNSEPDHFMRCTERNKIAAAVANIEADDDCVGRLSHWENAHPALPWQRGAKERIAHHKRMEIPYRIMYSCCEQTQQGTRIAVGRLAAMVPGLVLFKAWQIS